jgi:diguanylate cyclase (GGDEF)-like protein/PAS domain S-box-containing protein
MSQARRPLPDKGQFFLEQLLNIGEEGVAVHDASGKIVFCNQAAGRILGLAGDDILGASSGTFAPATIREDGSPFPAGDHPVMVTLRTGEPCTKVVMGIEWNPERRCTWVSVNSAIIPPTAGEPAMVCAIFTDITPHVEAKRRLQERVDALEQKNRELSAAESSMRNLLQAIPDRVWVKDPNGIYTFCNAALARVHNASEAEVIGKTDYDLSSPAQAEFFQQKDLEAARGDGTLVIEETATFQESASRSVFETVRVPMRDKAGRLLGVLGIARDVTERHDLQERLRQSNFELKTLADELRLLALTDKLTGLPNRRAFEEAIHTEFLRGKRLGMETSVLVIDIDHFKRVNDRFGHEAGDAALVCVAGALRATGRAFDMPARLGGEEFALLLPDTVTSSAIAIAERLRDRVERTEVMFAQKRFGLTISVGVASFWDQDEEWPAAVTRADAALYEAKASGRNRVRARHAPCEAFARQA